MSARRLWLLMCPLPSLGFLSIATGHRLRMEAIHSLFSCHSLRCTRQRTRVYTTLKKCTCHPTAEQLHQFVNDDSPGTSLATVYNTLEALCDAGLCRRIATHGGGTRYDADVTDHVHLVASDGSVMDLPNELGQELLDGVPREVLARLEEQLGVTITHLDVQLTIEQKS